MEQISKPQTNLEDHLGPCRSKECEKNQL